MYFRSLAILMTLLSSSSFVAAPQPAPGSGGYVLVCNKSDHSVGIIDPSAGKMIATVPDSGITVHEVIATPDGKTAFAPVYGNSGVGLPGTDGTTIDVIDIAARKRIATIDLGKPSRPHCPMINPRDGLLYVTTEITQSITVIDPKTLKVVGSIPTGQPESHMLAISHSGKRGYTANVGPGTVSVLDLVHRKNLAVIHVTPNTQRVAVSMDDREVFTADQKEPRVAVIDTATNKVKDWIPLPAVAYGTAVTLDGRWLLAAEPDTNNVAVVDLRTLRVARAIPVGKMPQEVIITPDGSTAYVSCVASHQVAEINLKTWKMDKLIEAGKGADGLAWASER